jgi:hypothetical protein
MCLGVTRAHAYGIGQAKLHKLDTYYHQRTEEDRLMPLRNLEERMAKFQVTPRRTVCLHLHRDWAAPKANDKAALWTLRCGGASTHAVRWCMTGVPLSTPRTSPVYVMQCGNALTNGRRGAVQTAA